MRNIVPRWFAVLAASSLAIVGYSAWTSINTPSQPQFQDNAIVESASENTEITLDGYFWLDSVPESAYTPFNTYVFTNKMGINNHFESTYKMLIELFEYNSNSNTIKFHFPHDRRLVDSNYTIKAYNNSKYPFLTAELTLASDPQSNGKKKSYFTGPDLHLKSQHASLPAELQAALNAAQIAR